jgi:hypothetical protein
MVQKSNGCGVRESRSWGEFGQGEPVICDIDGNCGVADDGDGKNDGDDGSGKNVGDDSYDNGNDMSRW